MATGEDRARGEDDGELLPDEAAVIAERLDELDDEENHLTVDELADDLGLDTE